MMTKNPGRRRRMAEPPAITASTAELAAEDPKAPLQLSIVIPTYHERENLRPLIKRLDRALRGIAWEAIFVDDDSADGTAEFVRKYAVGDRRIRCLRRIGRRGLSSA